MKISLTHGWSSAIISPVEPRRRFVGITAYGIFSRGLISENWRPDAANPGDLCVDSPRFQGKNAEHNLALVEALRQIAETKGVSVAQIAIA